MIEEYKKAVKWCVGDLEFDTEEDAKNCVRRRKNAEKAMDIFDSVFANDSIGSEIRENILFLVAYEDSYLRLKKFFEECEKVRE